MCKTAHILSYSPIPSVNKLSATQGIKEIMLDRFDSKSYLYTEGQLFLGILGDSLGGILKGTNRDKIFPRIKCPKSRMAVNLIREDSAWSILDGLTRTILPRCGAKTNLIKLVEKLSIYGPARNYKGDTLLDFIERANTCEETIEYGGAELGTNQFFEKVLDILNGCPQTQQYMLKINGKYSKHRKHNFGTVFQTKVVQYFTDQLKRVDADFDMPL